MSDTCSTTFKLHLVWYACAWNSKYYSDLYRNGMSGLSLGLKRIYNVTEDSTPVPLVLSFHAASGS